MNFKVIVGTYSWTLGGVSVFSVNLVRGLLAKEIPARILVTGRDHDDSPQPLPPGIALDRLSVRADSSWRVRWRAMIRYLEGQAPCVYIPNNDFGHCCVSPKLSSRVAVVGTLHSPWDLPCFHHLGRYWNATVAGSRAIAERASSLCPDLAGRIVMIPYGVVVPSGKPKRTIIPEAPLKIMYCGRVVHDGKRVLDLPKIVEALLARGVPAQLTIAGGGPDEASLMTASQRLVEMGVIRFAGILPNEEMPKLFEESDVFILTSEVEGKPLSLIEAMGCGCVPVVSDTPSGIRELVDDGVNGYRVPIGTIEPFADRLATLYRDVERRRGMSLNAFATVDKGGYRLHDMTQCYIDVFRNVWREVECGRYRRPSGRITLPPYMREDAWQDKWKRRLPTSVRTLGRYGKRRLHELRAAIAFRRRGGSQLP